LVKQGQARPSKVKQGQARPSKAKQGQARPSKAKQVQARPRKAKQGQTRTSKVKQGQAWSSKAKLWYEILVPVPGRPKQDSQVLGLVLGCTRVQLLQVHKVPRVAYR